MIAHQRAIHPPVIVPFEFENQLAPGVCAREAHGELHGFASARSKRHAFGARHDLLDFLRHPDLQFMLFTQRVRPLRRPPHGFHQGRMPVAQDHRPPGQHVVDVFVAIDVA